MSFFRYAFLRLWLTFWVVTFAACQSHEEAVYFPHQHSDLPAEDLIHYGRLENGLRYAVMQNSTPSNTATLLMHVDTGSLNESDDELGLAHFLEHMAFNGSTNVPEGEMIPRLEKFGLAFGPDTNASTDFKETIYQLELPEVSEDIINEGLFLMRETASNLLLEGTAIDNERGVILAEKRARTSPAYHASVAWLEYILGGTLLPERLPIGTEDTINTVTPGQFRKFYEGYYRPENTFIVLVGDIEVDYGISKIAEYFDSWESVGDPRPQRQIEPLSMRHAEFKYYSNPEIQTSVSLNVRAAPDLRKDNRKNRQTLFIENLGNSILSRRLAKIAQTTDATFISASAGTSTAYDAVQISSVSLSTEPERWADALATAEQELRKAYLFSFTQAELDEQILNIKRSLKLAIDRSETRRTPSLARQISSHISNDTVMTGPVFNQMFFESFVDTITIEQVHEAFKQLWLGYDNPQIYLSTSMIIAEAETVMEQTLRQSQNVEVRADEIVDLKAFAYTNFDETGKVESRQQIEDIDFEQVIFDNGVLLNLKKTPYQKGVISIQVAYGRGEAYLPDGDKNLAQGLSWLVGNALALGGLEAHSADDIRTLMAGKTVGVGHNMGVKRMFMDGSTTAEDLPTQLNMMMAYYLEPGFRAESKARYDKWISSFYPTLDSTPSGVASKYLPRLIRSGDERFGIPDEAVLRSASLEVAKAWMASNRSNASIEIGVVGDIDKEQIIEEIARTFGSLPSVLQTVPEIPEEKTYLKFAQGQLRPEILSHAGEASTALLRIYWPSFDGQDDMIERRVNILRSMFQLRLTEVIREELGASYSPSAFYSGSRIYPDFGFLGVSVEVNPVDIDKAEARIHSLAQDFANGNIEPDIFVRAMKPIQESIEESLENNNYWMGVISTSQTDPERLERHRRRYEAYHSMTLNDVLPVARKVFDHDKAVTYHILPAL